MGWTTGVFLNISILEEILIQKEGFRKGEKTALKI